MTAQVIGQGDALFIPGQIRSVKAKTLTGFLFRGVLAVLAYNLTRP